MYHDHTTCRACGNRNLEEGIDFGVTPLVNDFRAPGEERAGFAPLKLLVCHDCGLPQLSVVVDPHILYDNYPYIHSDSKGLRTQFAALTALLYQHRAQLGSVLEFGSNDGLFLSTLKDLPGVERVFGIDPAQSAVVAAQQRGVSSHCALFGEKVAKELGEPWDTIVARHVFAHIDDWAGVVRGLEAITHKDSIVALEVQYGADLLARGEWDMIYHEHLSYVTVRSMIALLQDSPLYVADVTVTEWMGGSIVFLLRRRESNILPTLAVSGLVSKEPADVGSWRDMGVNAFKVIHQLENKVARLVGAGEMVWGYGAPAKATNWIHQCRFTPTEIRWVTDTTPAKQGKLIPGTDIRVVSRESVPGFKVEQTAVLFAWNFEEEIVEREQAFLKEGGNLLVPLPEPHFAGRA